MSHTLLVILGTALLGLAAGIVGVLAMLRRQALLGDVLAHATLPGLALAFLVVASKQIEALLLGAIVSCVAAALTVWILDRWTRLKADARLGLVLGVFFGTGMAVLGSVQDVPGGGQAGLEAYLFGKPAGMLQRDLVWLSVLASVCLMLVVLCYKEFQLLTFDATFARAQGWPVQFLDVLLLGLVVLVVVIGLPVVGVVMVSAMLILPAATARFWTNRLHVLLLLAGTLGASMGVVGTLISTHIPELPAGPTIILSGTVFFALSLLFGAKRGLLIRRR
jgi:manganese/zinc/iron transport system permease protein